jgi:peptidoglycan/LPS O-acetylase OafA/YrhL
MTAAGQELAQVHSDEFCDSSTASEPDITSKTAGQMRAQPVKMPLIDPLRLLLASAVVVTHAYSVLNVHTREPLFRASLHRAKFGDLAVDGFFIVSGMLICASWMSHGWKRYFLSRIARIYPAFVIVSIVCCVVTHANAWIGVKDALLLLPPGRTVLVDLPTWTIHWEFACYLAVAVLGALGVLRFPALVAGAVVLAGCAYGLQARGPMPENILNATMFNGARFAYTFGLGMLLHLYRARLRVFPWVTIGAAVITVWSVGAGYISEVWPIAMTIFVLHLSHISLTWRTPADPSYGVYLYHFPILSALATHGTISAPWLLVLCGYPIAMTLAICSWYAVEKPCLDWARHVQVTHSRVRLQ